ncbi:cysteine hydrolase [Pararhizobium mangrovi]|uniref:Cysteine hydrolase n=1 Tax=Pararhizobium mangrovi TaxID=2590452 RepID=A0A506TXE0_9HYPH|nr:cysteine hydrolase [Pararhizobium mangrovi]TPW25828.1 cysteine hydrolase [Pararhizobium mangrovi]
MDRTRFQSANTRHVIVDMQRLFAEDTVWHTPVMETIAPRIGELAKAFRGRNHFTKFMVPLSPDHASGNWRTYYERWSDLTLDRLDPAMLDVVPSLAEYVEPERLIEKPTYSLFKVADARDALVAEGVDTLVFSGVETDVCVLASLMEAIDLGFHTVLVTDALGSSDMPSHAAILKHVVPRMPEQIEMMTSEELLALANGAG